MQSLTRQWMYNYRARKFQISFKNDFLESIAEFFGIMRRKFFKKKMWYLSLRYAKNLENQSF